MAQFIPFNPKVEVNGQTVLSIINGINEVFKPKMKEILKRYNLEKPEIDKWYNQKNWLNAFKDISETIGKHTLFSIGKAIPENAIFPPQINNLETALNSIDIAYHQNHRGGEIGYYKLIKFDSTNREAVMECKNPYPCHFDRGIITSIVRKFTPSDSLDQNIVLDTSKKSRLEGGETSWYIITW